MFAQSLKHKFLQTTLLLVISLVTGVMSVSVATATTAVPLRADSDLLQERALQFMLQVNAARRDPLAVVERLGLDEQQVREVFADDLSVLDQGLPPLAWNENLVDSTAAHGRDMFDRLYYDYVSPEGVTAEQRIIDAGYQPLDSGETMNALFFENYVALDTAFQALVDAMLRDELTGATVERNIFNPDFTELGVSFFAESISLLNDQPYVYLLVADFATPVEPQRHIIVEYDQNSRLLMRTAVGGTWIYPQTLSSGVAQFICPDVTTELVVVDENGLGVVSRNFVLQDVWEEENMSIDMRTTDAVAEN